MSLKHTMAPWRAVEAVESIGGGWTVLIGNMSTGVRVLEVGQSEGDAKLIAAAPELLEGLRKIAFEPFGHAEATHEQVLDAITELARELVAKAEGQP